MLTLFLLQFTPPPPRPPPRPPPFLFLPTSLPSPPLSMDAPSHLRWSSARTAESLSSVLHAPVREKEELAALRASREVEEGRMSRDEVEEAIGGVREEMSRENARMEGKLLASQATVEELTGRLADMLKMLDASAAKEAGGDEVILDLQGNIAALEADKSQLAAACSRLSEVVTEARSDNETLKTDNAALTNKNGSLKSSHGSLLAETDRLRAAASTAGSDGKKTGEKQERLLADMEARWRKAMADQATELGDSHEKAAKEAAKAAKAADLALAEARKELATSAEQNGALADKCGKLLAGYNREKERGGEDVAAMEGRIRDAGLGFEGERAALVERVRELEEEVERLRGNQKEPVSLAEWTGGGGVLAGIGGGIGGRIWWTEEFGEKCQPPRTSAAR